jgi:hypothetical protein
MRYNHFSMLPETAFQPRNGRMSMTLEGGGGGGPSHTTSTVTQSSLPDWLRPQTEALLGAGTQEYFQTQRGPGGEMTITGLKPYVPYSADPRDYVAGFTPQQQRVMSETAAMQTPRQFAPASNLAQMGGMQSLQAGAYQPGQFAVQGVRGPSLQEFTINAPEQFGGQQAQQYMDPYMQQVVEIQKQKAIDDAQRAQLGQNLASARQGTYGGARQMIAQTQREAALGKQLSDIQATGSQAAFQQAQQQFERDRAAQLGVAQQNLSALLGVQQLGAGQSLEAQRANQAALMEAQKMAEQSRQFGGELGIRGAGQAVQAGQTLGQLGAQQQQADLARMQFQQQIAAMPQEQQQRIIDQAVQNFALAQEAPFQRLAGYSGLLRGYATPTMTTEAYRSSPSPASQLAGLGALAYGVGMPGKKKGGAIKDEGIDALAITKAKRKKVSA